MKRISMVAVTVLLLCSLAFSGCGQTQQTGGNAGGQDEPIQVLFIPKLTGNAFFESANEGAQAYAKDQGFEVIYAGSPQALVSEQEKIIREALAQEQKVHAICISALDAVALDGVLKEAISAGITVTTWDSDVSGDARRIMVSQGTPDQLGKMLVEMGAKGLVGRGMNPAVDPIRYVWHYSQASVTDQNSWRLAGEAYIQSTYPTWENVAPQNYYSDQNPDKAIAVGNEILENHPGIDLIICNDSTSLPGQAEAAKNSGFTAVDVTITGFASPNAMRQYCEEGIVER